MSGHGEIGVVLADGPVTVREALAQILQESGCIRVVGQAADGPGAVATATQTRPDVLVLDYSMPGMTAPEVVSSLRQLLPHLKVLVLTVHENIHYCVRVLESGAHGYVVKSDAVA